MEKSYNLNNCLLQVFYCEKIITIGNPKELQKYLSTDIKNRTSIFVDLIKEDYLAFIGKEFNIKKKSIMIEIWGHVYASHFARAMRKLISLKPVEQFADFIIKKSDSIDCGESDVDGNRKFWDILSKIM